MKKLIYILMFLPFFFLTSCSSGGDAQPTVKSAEGVWEADIYTINGEDQLEGLSAAYFYCWGDSIYGTEAYDLEGNIIDVAVGLMSYNSDQTMINCEQYLWRYLLDGVVYESTDIVNFGYEISKFTSTELDVYRNMPTSSVIMKTTKTDLTLPSVSLFNQQGLE
tara:strand:- start:7 stop:498 length:492 start_codon:yes stop_codon:yes gene_type:complete